MCTNGGCLRKGARATLVELEELASLIEPTGACTVAEYNCFGLCGRGPNVSIDWDDGTEEMNTGVRGTEQSLEIIHKATGAQLEVTGPLSTRLRKLRRVSGWEQALVDAQTVVDVLDISSLEQRASANCQREYDGALAHVDRVLAEAPASAHPRRLAESIRRQIVAARAGRPPSPEVEDVLADDPETWPDEG